MWERKEQKSVQKLIMHDLINNNFKGIFLSDSLLALKQSMAMLTIFI